jgi:hypothetical protein
MDPEAELWHAVGHLFSTDDGSLPDVVFDDLRPAAIQTLFELLLARAAPDALQGQSRWDDDRAAEVAILDRPDAPSRAGAGDIPGFHVMLDSIRAGAVLLPTLGVFVEQGRLTLDYRMGAAWNERTVAAFARLLGDMWALAPHTTPAAVHDGGDIGDADPTFEQALLRYLASTTR